MRALQGDALSDARVTDPIYKLGQDPGGGVADGLYPRAMNGPRFDLIGTSPATPATLAESEEAIYTDTIDVTDANYLVFEIGFFWQATGGAETTDANLGIGLQASSDGFYWFTVPVIDRVNLIAPATMFRNDAGTTALGTLSTTGGLASATTTQNAPLLEDLLALLPAPATAAADTPMAKQTVVPWAVGQYQYVRGVFVPVFTELDNLPPLLLVRAYKAASP